MIALKKNTAEFSQNFIKKYASSSVILGLALSLSGCASALNGSQEKILIYSKPEGAQCKIYQGGQIQKTFTTPQKLVVQRSREQDLSLNCFKDGYQLSAQSWDPDVQNGTAGDAVTLVSGIATVPWWIAGLFVNTTLYDSEHQSAYGYPKYIGIDLRRLEKGEAVPVLPETFQKPAVR